MSSHFPGSLPIGLFLLCEYLYMGGARQFHQGGNGVAEGRAWGAQLQLVSLCNGVTL